MKAKLLSKGILGLAAMMTLAACGGTKIDDSVAAKAVTKVRDGSIAYVTSTGNALLEDVKVTLSADNNDSITLTTSQVTNISGSKYTVNLEWSYDESEYIKGFEAIEGDETHKKLTFNYPGPDFTVTDKNPLPQVTFKGVITCGSVSETANFVVELNKMSNVHDEMTIEQLYATKDSTVFKPGEKMFNIQNDDNDGWIAGNAGQKYLYVRVSGKLTYVSPDKNWGILQDGIHCLELYRLDASSDSDKAIEGKYVTVEGNMSNGYGNLQLAYVTKIEYMEDHSSIKEPVAYGELNEGLNDSTSADYLNFAGDGALPNSIATLTNVTLSSNLAGKASLDSRFTFTVKKGTHDFVIAFDYHVCKNNTAAFAAWQTLADNAVKGTTKFTIRGTVRYSTDDGTNTLGGAGQWTLTPMILSDWVAA